MGLRRWPPGSCGYGSHELRIWAQDAGAPTAIEGEQCLPEPAGEAKRLGSLAEAVAVGRIHHEKSRWRWNLIVPEVGHREANIVRDLRASGIAAGNLHGAGVAIRSENRCVCSRARGDGLAQALPRVRVMRGPAFKGEGAAGTW